MQTEIITIVDRSGSMVRIKQDMLGGLRTFVEEQKKVAGEAGFTLVNFDDIYDLVLEGVDIQDVKITDEMLVPRGSTALLDAIGKTIISQGERFAKMNPPPNLVLLVIITDGLENASKEWKSDKVKELLKEQQEKWKWGVTFLGANIDAISTAEDLGIDINAALNVGTSPADLHHAYGAMSRGVASSRVEGMAAMSYSAEDRKKAKTETKTSIS